MSLPSVSCQALQSGPIRKFYHSRCVSITVHVPSIVPCPPVPKTSSQGRLQNALNGPRSGTRPLMSILCPYAGTTCLHESCCTNLHFSSLSAQPTRTNVNILHHSALLYLAIKSLLASSFRSGLECRFETKKDQIESTSTRLAAAFF